MKHFAISTLFFGGLLILGSCENERMVDPEGGDLVVASATTVSRSMVVGNLTLQGNAVLVIDYTATPANTFVVKGNVLVKDNAQLIVRGAQGLLNDGFIIANEYSSQYTFTSTDHSRVRFENIGIRTQTGTVSENGNIYMSYDARDNSSLEVDGAQLDNTSSWLLGTFRNKSRLEIFNAINIPTETYLSDSCTVAIGGSETKTGLWLPLTSGQHSVQLPDVSSGSWSWQTGPSLSGSVHWSLSVTESNPGLGIQMFPNASAEITGHGTSQKEVTISYFASGSNEILNNLHVGLQNGAIIPGRLTLNNVNLGPIAWQIYSLTSSALTINNSVINEIGVMGNGSVTINNSLIQLAVLACYGQNSSLNVNGCEVWNQSIETNSNGVINLTNCTVHGSQFFTRSAESKILITGGSFQNNPPANPEILFIDLLTGQPNYNPFCAPGPPKRSGAGVISCSNVTNCSW